MKKVTSILMAFVLMLTLIPTAWAEGGSAGAGTDVAMIGDATYETLADAVAKADNSATIQLLKDTAEDITIPADKTITIDLNGNTLTNVNSHTILNNGTLTITGAGKVDNISHGKGALYNKGTVFVNGGTFDRSKENGKNSNNSGSNSWYTIKNVGTMTINGGATVQTAGRDASLGKFSSLVSNGYFDAEDYATNKGIEQPILTINGGTFCGGLNTIKNDDRAKLTINGGTFSNYYQAVVQNHNIAEITGGTFTAASDASAETYGIYNCGCAADIDIGTLTVSGGTFTGATYAVADVSRQNATVTISGGHFTGTKAAIIKGSASKATITVTGGTFSSDPTAYLAAGYTASENNGTFTVVPKDYVAQIGETKYESLADAVAVGGDIKLLKDVTLTRGLAIKKDITLDLNGKTLVRKDGLIFDVYSNMTVKNGTVKFSEKPAESGAAIWVNETAKLTVESNVTVEAPDNCFDIAYDKSCTAAEVILRGKLVGGSGVTMNGNIGAGTSNKLTVDGATIDVTGHGIYQAGCADTNFTINNSVITGGSTGIEVRAGKLTVTNSTITGNGTIAVNPNGSGTTTDGAGIAIAQHTTKQPIDVTIAGGTVTGEYAIYESNPQKNSAADIAKVKVAVAGGTFTGKIYSEDITGFVTGGTFNTNPKDYVPAAGYTVAKKGDVYTVAKKDPDKDGTGETTSAVKLEVPATSDTVIDTTVNKNDIETNKELTVTNNKTAVTINQAGVAAIGTGANLNLSIKADSKTPESANTAAYNKAMAGKDANSAVVVNISLTSGTSKVFATDVAGAYALVTVPYSTDKADKLTVYYLNGSDATALTKVADAAAPGAALNTFSYDAPNKLITLKLPHFSEYLISTTATRSVVHHYGGSGTTTTTGTKTNSPGTFDAGVGIYAVSAILSVTGMAWVGTKQRKH